MGQGDAQACKNEGRWRGLSGQAKVFDQAYAYLKKRSRWMRYQAYRRQHLPIGSGVTEVSQRQYPSTDPCCLSYDGPDRRMTPQRRCREETVSDAGSARTGMATSVLPPRLSPATRSPRWGCGGR